MSDNFTLNAAVRADTGKGASRRLRRLSNGVPAIVYGGDKAPSNITIAQNEFVKQLENEAFYSHIVTLKIGDETESVILKDLQRHPAKAIIMHADFLRVSKSQKLSTRVPLHFINEDTCKGVKLQGGSILHNMNELEISCLPGDLPEFIEVDLLEAEVGQIVHISDLKLPQGVESVALAHGSDHDLPVATIQKAKGSAGDESEGDEGASEE